MKNLASIIYKAANIEIIEFEYGGGRKHTEYVQVDDLWTPMRTYIPIDASVRFKVRDDNKPFLVELKIANI